MCQNPNVQVEEVFTLLMATLIMLRVPSSHNGAPFKNEIISSYFHTIWLAHYWDLILGPLSSCESILGLEV